MKTRRELLLELLALKGSIKDLLEKLSVFGYDSEAPEIIVKPSDIEMVLLNVLMGLLVRKYWKNGQMLLNLGMI